MDRRAFLSGAAAAPAASAAAGGQVKEQPAHRFPNILFVDDFLIDDSRRRIRTPPSNRQ